MNGRKRRQIFMNESNGETPPEQGLTGSPAGVVHPDSLLRACHALDIGLILVASSSEVVLCTPRAVALLELPAPFLETPYPLASLIAALGDVAADESGGTFVLHRGDAAIEIAARPAGGGATLFTVTDATETRRRERALLQAESQFRSLFENSVYGIYRDTLDGMPVRVNPALAALNGYASEQEHIAAVEAHAGSWYVDPSRGPELLRTLERDGRVSDFVSQVRRHRTGEPVWVTENTWYVRDDDGTPLFIEGTIQDATERMAAAEALNRQIRVDGLTGAASRFRFLEVLEAEAAKSGGVFALYCIDLDMFKDINDLFGHAAGDEVLKTVASRLQAIAPAGSLVARLGGDEFALLSPRDEDIRNPEILAHAIVECTSRPVEAEGRAHVVRASVGISVFPRHGTTGGEVLRNADTALYEAKSRGRNGWRLFDQDLRQAVAYRKAVETNLRGAATRNELELHYQAIVDSSTRMISGFEGLMRWHSPVMGRVSPVEFIPVAEQAGLMMDIGAWAITRACEDASIFHNNIRFSVNVSASQFRAPGLVAHVANELDRFSVSPERLVLEITESVLVSNEQAARNLLNDLRRLGVQIAIDDFGTGYSSLSYLQHLPINVVKIDRSFVAGMMDQKANRAVIRAIMGIGRDLGIRVVAEGVETEAQAQALRNEGCQYIQGFLYSTPKPLSAIVADLSVNLLGQHVVAPQRKTA
jgi:diguanylate cyclase (GGDEF)-like protein/PAS domain S-box-containing protein